MADPDHTIGPLRVLTIRGFDFFHVGACTTFEDLDRTTDELLDRLSAAQREGRVTAAGPSLLVWGPTDRSATWDRAALFTMEVGFPVEPEASPVEPAGIRRLADFRCASVLCSGALKHLEQGYRELAEGVRAAGLVEANERREWHLYFESVDSPNNVTLLMVGLE